jgi:hypothetical protein
MINKDFYFYCNTGSFVQSIIGRCCACQIQQTKNPPAPIFPFVMTKPNERWTMDFSQFKKNFWLLLVIDSYTRRIWGEVFSTKEEKNVIHFLEHLRIDYRLPQWIQSDNGGEFIGKELSLYLGKHYVNHINGRPYHPQSQGICERANRTVKSGLAKQIIQLSLNSISIEQCRDLLKSFLHSYNIKIHSSTGFSPYSIYHNIKVNNNPGYNEVLHKEGIPGKLMSEEEIQQMHMKVSTNISNRAKSNQKFRYAIYKNALKDKVLVVGELVMVQPDMTPKTKKSSLVNYALAKISKILIGTDYAILEWITDGPKSSDKPGTLSKQWPLSCLAGVNQNTNLEDLVKSIQQYSPWGTEYEIDDILYKFYDILSNTNFYLIQWTGYNLNESSWEKEQNIGNITLVNKYIKDKNINIESGILSEQKKDLIFNKLNIKSIKIKNTKQHFFEKVLTSKNNQISNFKQFELENLSISNSRNIEIDQISVLNKNNNIPNGQPVVSLIQIPDWIKKAIETIENIGFWLFQPYIYNTKIKFWNDFIETEGTINDLKSVLNLLKWENIYILETIKTTHPNNLFSIENSNFF